MLADTTMSSTVISFEIYGVPSSQVAQGQPCLRTIYNKLWSWRKVYVRGQDVAQLVTCLPNVQSPGSDPQRGKWKPGQQKFKVVLLATIEFGSLGSMRPYFRRKGETWYYSLTNSCRVH